MIRVASHKGAAPFTSTHFHPTMPKRQPTNRELLEEIQRLRLEVERANMRPIVIPQPYPVVPMPQPYTPWQPYRITWGTGTNIQHQPDPNVTVVWNAQDAQSTFTS